MKCGVKAAWPGFHVPAPTPSVFPFASAKTTGSISLPLEYASLPKPEYVPPSAGVERQVRIAEAGVDRRARRTRRVEEPVAEPVDTVVGRGPDVDLVAVVRDEAEVAEGRAEDSVAIEVRRPFVRGVNERS